MLMLRLAIWMALRKELAVSVNRTSHKCAGRNEWQWGSSDDVVFLGDLWMRHNEILIMFGHFLIRNS
jgi:hypothetical protein